jgi:predicted nucleic acid-binding protein
MYCIDASVFINSEIEGEQFHEYSAKLMQTIKKQGITIIVPEIALPEIGSAIARGTDDTIKALEFLRELKQIPNIVFVPIDRELAAVAYMFNAKLITLDKQQSERASECIEVASPQDELKNLKKFKL